LRARACRCSSMRSLLVSFITPSVNAMILPIQALQSTSGGTVGATGSTRSGGRSDGSGSGRRTTAAPLESPAGVIGKGSLGGAHAEKVNANKHIACTRFTVNRELLGSCYRILDLKPCCSEQTRSFSNPSLGWRSAFVHCIAINALAWANSGRWVSRSADKVCNFA